MISNHQTRVGYSLHTHGQLSLNNFHSLVCPRAVENATSQTHDHKRFCLFSLLLNVLGMYFCHSLDIDMSHMSSVRLVLDQKHLAGAMACH